MSKLTKEVLETVTIPFFESPVDGKTYTVTTRAAGFAANIRDLMMSGLRQSAVQVYAKIRSLEVAALKSGDVNALRDVFVAMVVEVSKLVPENGKEHGLLRAGRHQLSAMLEVLSPEDHAQYRAIKYTGADDAEEGAQPKAKAEKRHEAMAIAATVIAKATLVPGF